MGLLGGFKGKLIGKNRKQNSDKGHVVGVNFKTFSEFAAPSTSNEVVSEVNKKVVRPDTSNRVIPNVPKKVVQPVVPQAPQLVTKREAPQPRPVDTPQLPKARPPPPPVRKPATPEVEVKPVVPTESIQFPLPDNDDDQGNFKIHFTQNRTYEHKDSQSEESESESEEEEEEAVSPVNYSSQANSIFFGEEEEPVLTRPRNFSLPQDDEDSDGSGASA